MLFEKIEQQIGFSASTDTSDDLDETVVFFAYELVEVDVSSYDHDHSLYWTFLRVYAFLYNSIIL